MITSADIRRIITSRQHIEPSDDFRIIDSWTEYSSGGSKPVPEQTVDYICFELEVADPVTGEKSHIFKAIQFCRVRRLPKSAKESRSLMDMHTQVLSSVWENEINFVTVIANIMEPVPIGLLFLYGVQGVGNDIEEAKEKAHNDFLGLIGSLQGTYRVLELSRLTSEESEWLKEKMYSMKYITAVRGIPKSHNEGVDVSKGVGNSKSQANPDGQATLEELIVGMVDYEYVIEIISTPVYTDTLKAWSLRTEQDMTDWYGQLQGTKGYSFNLSIPMMYMANQSTSSGWSQAYTDAESVSYNEGTSFTTSYGENTGISLSETFGTSIGHTDGISSGESVSFSHSVTEGDTVGHTEGTTVGHTEGVTVGDTIGHSDSYTEGITEGVTHGITHGTTDGVTTGVTDGTTVGNTIGHTVGHSEGNSFTHTVGNSYGESFGDSHSVSENWGNSHSDSVNNGTSTSHSLSDSASWSDSFGESSSHGTSHSASVSNSESESFGTSRSEGYSESVSSSHSNSSNYGQSFGKSESSSLGSSSGLTTGHTSGTTSGTSYTHSTGTSQSQTSGTTTGHSTSNSHSTGSSSSQNYGTNHSDNHSDSTGTSNSNGWSHSNNNSNTHSDTQSNSGGYSVGTSNTQGSTYGTSNSDTGGSSYTGSQSTSNSDTSSQSTSHSGSSSSNDTTSSGSNLGASAYGLNIGANNSSSHGSGTGSSDGTGSSSSSSSGTGDSTSLGYSDSHTQGTSKGESSSTSVTGSRNQSYSEGSSDGWSRGTSDGTSGSTSDNRSSSNGYSDGYSSGYSNGRSSSDTRGTSDSYSNSNSRTNGTSSSFSQGNSYSNSESSSVSNSHGSSSSRGETTSSTTSLSQGVSDGTSHGITVSSTEGTSQSRSSSIGYGVTNGSSESVSENLSHSQGGGTSVSDGYGTSFSSGYSDGTSYSSGISDGTSHTVSSTESVSDGITHSFTDSYSDSVSESHSRSHSDSLSQSHSQSLSYSDSNSLSNSRSHGTSDSTSHSVSNSSSESFSKSLSDSVSHSRLVSEGTSTGTNTGRSSSDSTSESRTSGKTDSTGASKSISNGTSSGTSKGRNKGESIGSTGGFSAGTSSSMGLGPSIGYSKSYQWVDQQVKDILELLEFQNQRLKKALRGEGAMYTYVYVACPNLDALSTAMTTAKSTWQNEYAMIQPLQVLDLDDNEQDHLLYRFTAFSSDVTREIVAGAEEYKYATVLLSGELTALTHLPRISEGGIYANVDDIPKFAVPSMMKGEIYMGTILSAERFSFNNGYCTPFDYRLNESELMHGIFAGASRSGKTVAAIRFAAELSKVRRKTTGKRLRLVCMDPKTDWRVLARYVEPERFKYYSLGNINFHPINLNPWKIPKNIWPQVWIDGIIDIYCRAYGLLERGKQMVGETVYALYEEAGVFRACDKEDWREKVPELSRHVTFDKICDRMTKIKAALEDPTNPKGRAGNDTRDAYARLLDRLQAFSREFSIERRLFSNEDGMSVDELVGEDDVTVFESSGLESTFSNFIFGVITSGFYKVAKSYEKGFLDKSQYETVLFIEEANKVLTGNDNATTGGGGNIGLPGQSEFEEILDQAAGYGLFIFAITQKVADMPSSVIANSGMMFAGRQVRPDDSAIVIRKIAREERYEDRDMTKWFPRAPIGWLVCQSSRGYDYKSAEPVLVKIARLNDKSPSNEELDSILTVKNAKSIIKNVY